MNIILQYIKSQMRHNKRGVFSVMASVFIASTLLCALCTWFYTQNKWMAQIEEYESGNWHAELGSSLYREDVTFIEGYQGIQTVMVKGPYTNVCLPEGSELPYLILRGADHNYWENMGEKNSILEGRVPQKSGEIVVSKTFFDRHPQYQLGDSLTLTKGDRIFEGKNNNDGIRQEDEVFVSSGEIDLTLVGILDVSTPTSTPGYYAMGFLDRNIIGEEEELTVYVSMQDIRDTYHIIPGLADLLGIEKDEYGEYKNHLRYHARLLSLNGVVPSSVWFSEKSFVQWTIYALLALVVAGAFVLIIHSIFAITTQARIHQLGMLSSVGATPGQIREAVILEGLASSLPGVLGGLLAGYFFAILIAKIYTGILGELVYFPVTVRTSWGVMAAAFLLSLGTALISAFIPARKAAGMSPVEAIRMQEGGDLSRRRQKGRKHFGKSATQRKGKKITAKEKKGMMGSVFGTMGWLAGNAYGFYRKSYRAGIAAMVMCILMVSGFFSFLEINNLITEKNSNSYYHNILLKFNLLAEPEPGMLENILEIPGIQEGIFYHNQKVSAWIDPARETEEFSANGGLAAVNPDQFSVLERDGSYRLRVILFGLEDADFASYCNQIGEDPKDYYNIQNPKAVMVSQVPKNPDAFYLEDLKEEYPMLTWQEGEDIVLEEKLFDDDETDYQFTVKIGALTQKRPILDATPAAYSIQLYFPKEVYFSITEHFSPEKAESIYKIYGAVLTPPEEELRVAQAIREICGEYLAESDYQVLSMAENALDGEVSNQAMEAVMNIIGLLLLLIGIASAVNGVVTVLNLRRREFAMLRSVGMDHTMICRLLMLEGIRMAFTPVLVSIPVLLVMCAFILKLRQIPWMEFLLVFPVGKVALNLAAVTVAVVVSYYLVSCQIRKDTIVEALREDLV